MSGLNSVQNIAIRQHIAGEYTVTRVQSDGSAVVRQRDADGRFLVVADGGDVAIWSDGQEAADAIYPFPKVQTSLPCQPSMAAWRLAFRHGHRWASDVYDGERVDLSPEAIEAALAISQEDRMCSTSPADYHTTATGRVVWSTTPGYCAENGEPVSHVKLEIHRSDRVVGGLGGGTIPVLRVILMAGKKSGTGLISESNTLEVSPLADRRHYSEMWQLLAALGQWDHGCDETCVLWEQVSRGALGLRRYDRFTPEDLTAAGIIAPDTEPVVCY